MSHTYRADDPISARWTGKGGRLTNYEGDLNEYQQNTRLDTLEANYSATVSLDHITQPNAYTLIFHLTDATQLGPFTLPSATFTDRGDWATNTAYLVNDTFNAPDGGLYRVLFAHTSDPTTFDPAANDGMGHDYYAPMIPPRGNALPAGGIAGWYFRKNSSTDYDANWAQIQASEVGYDASTESTLSADNVFDALDELDAKAVALDFRVDALEVPSVIDAIDVVFNPSSDTSLTSNNVADALEELEALSGGVGALIAANNLSDVANAATSRTNLGLGTGDSPQFTGVNVGHASDTTITRSSAGVIAVEGTTVALNSTSATHTAGTIELGAASDTTISRSAAGVIAVEGVPLYSNIPQNSQSTAYTTVLADAQKHILHPTADNNARTFTIDSNANVAYPIGTAITFINQINTVTIAITSDTLVLAGAGSTGSRTLAANGVATAIKIATTTWLISGTGLT